jgi:DNA polymerase I-like protein with 3'-5' exonuclease and polymerase domains
MFVPRIEGHEFVELDYSSFEARILAALAKDTALDRAIDQDIHAYNQAKLGVDRTRAKNGFYGWSYGAGARTLRDTFRAKGYTISQAECAALLRGLDELYPRSAQWRNGVIANAKISKYVTNPFGLRRYFYGSSPGTAPANAVIQSTAAIIMWKVLPSLAEEARRLGGCMVAMVHDSVEFELPEGADVSRLQAIMEQEFPEVAPGFAVPVNVKRGPSWGEVRADGVVPDDRLSVGQDNSEGLPAAA